MKSVFNTQAWRRMAGLSASLFLSGLFLVPFAAGGAQTTWDSRNSGNNPQGSFITTPPVIDANNFINYSTWNIGAFPYPYHTSDTLTYYNHGVMYSIGGWGFDLGPSGSGSTFTLRSMSGSFTNASNGTIQSDDIEYPYPPIPSGSSYRSFLGVSATNIVNQGLLAAGSSGQIQLNGANVNLSSSMVEIVPPTPSSSGSAPFFISPTNIIPSKGFNYFYWAQTNMNFLSSNLWDGLRFNVPLYNVTELVEGNNPCPRPESAGEFSFAASSSFTFYTNRSGGFPTVFDTVGNQVPGDVATNYFYEVVFIVPPNQANFTGDARFTLSPNPTNLFDTVAVRLVQTVVNPVTLSLQDNTLYLVDTLASTTNSGFFQAPPNASLTFCSDPTYQPQNFLVSRSDVNLGTYYPNSGLSGLAFGDGLPGFTGLPTNNFLYNTIWTNNNVAARYAALDTFINNITTLPRAGAAGIDHSGGRVQISAGNLNLGLTRMSGEGWIDIQGKHLVDSVGAVVDCQNLSFDLGSTNGSLIFTNLALSTVNRFQGNVVAWSATWSNLLIVTEHSHRFDALNSVWVPTNVTFGAQANLYVLVVDANASDRQVLGTPLGSPVPVKVVDLHLHATNSGGGIVIGDAVIVTNSFFMDGQSLTIQNSVALSDGVQSWIWTNAPTLRYFTNNGSLTIPSSAHFGDDGPTTNSYYLAFVNHRSISAGSQMINSYYFENDGVLNANVGCYATIWSGKFQNGQVNSGSDIQFSANDLKFNQSSLRASGGELDFTVTNSLADTGGGSGNSFTCDFGFNLWIKPQTGDLLGTTMRTVAPNIGSIKIYHFWAGTNCGPVNAGFSNNVALGQLVLAPQGSVVSFPPTFFFAGTNYFGGTGTNGLYVDLLDLTALGNNWTNIQQHLLQIDTNSLVIYYAAAKLGFTPPPAANGLPPQEPEEFLNGQFGGHLRWVRTFAGPNSSVAVVINGLTYEVNKAYRFATTIDSNTNGIPNYADPNPFSTPPPFSAMLLTLNASLVPQGGQSHQIESQTNQSSPSVLALSWLAVSNTVYNVQFTTNLATANWQPLLAYTNNAPTNQTVTVFDTNAPTVAAKRFYRLYSP